MSDTCPACSGFIEKGADGVWRHLGRWEPCINARPRSRTATLINAEQRRALAQYLSVKIERNEWKYWVVGGLIAFYLALLSRGDWRIFAAGLVIGSLTTASIIATVERAHALLRRETTLIRVTGSLVVDTRKDSENDQRFVRVDGRELILDGEVHVGRELGGIEYTEKRGYPLAIWDRDGDLIWHRPEYEPAALVADTMVLTA
ncbi:MAG: hypothetical protein E6I19_01665 [Chloroflexi bacterium]|nr:MAG: hypothetical protein E6I48_02845 [Chloroflexota bacterium]TMF58405.1 MAG: hypothetical protein E6I19_01665 [Chloroflexota bacterium]